jgi:tetratricopeptide (TPR) repeat protein/DNA-binding CsgD family transcriptional regulator
MRLLLISISILLFAPLLQAQDPGYFVDQLKDNSDKQVISRLAVYDTLEKMDTATLVKTIAAIEKETTSSSARMKAKVTALSARLLFYKLVDGDSLYAAKMKDALYKAYELDEEFMIAEYSRWYAEMLNTLKKRDQAIQYGLNALRIQESLGMENFPSFNTFSLVIAEMFFKTKNFEQAIIQYNKALAKPAKDSVDPVLYANSLNTLGFAYRSMKRYDSSVLSFRRCMEFSKQHGLEDWYYIASDNRYDPFLEMKQYDSCKMIADDLYAEAVKTNDPNLLLAGNFLLGRLALRQGEFQKAVTHLLKSEEYSQQIGYKPNSVRGYKDLAECYDSLGQPALAYEYFRKYKQLQDSIDYVDKSITSNYVLAIANFEKEQLGFKRLKAKREREIRLRNIGILAVVLLSGFVIWGLNRNRRRARQSQQDAEKQLKRFAEDVLSRDEQIEALQTELGKQSNNAETAAKVEELSQQMILTEDDWQNFQSLFNKTYPGFLLRLKEKAPGITEAELRMATLTKIKLGTRQIAAMQGISTDTVHKTRQRLRQRFGTASTAELESIVSSI